MIWPQTGIQSVLCKFVIEASLWVMESCVMTSVTFVCEHVTFFFFFKDRQAFDCLNSCCLSFRICQAEEKVLKGQSLFASSAGHTRHTFGEERREPRALNG